MSSISGEEKVDRLPVKITCNKVDKLLGVPICDGTGNSTAMSVNTLLQEWNIGADAIEACCFDTTSVNTGKDKGAGVILEELLEKDLLFLSCRHRIYELVLKVVYEGKVAISAGRDEPLFVRFKNDWPVLKTKDFQSGICDPSIAEELKDIIEPTKNFIQQQLKKPICLDDYKEFLELALLFLRGSLNKQAGKSSFSPPDPNHHAR